jgi:mono/diheme cytochrome c family protein
MSRTTVNALLLATLLLMLGLDWSLRTDQTIRNVEFLPDMGHAVPAETFAASSVLAQGRTLQLPPEGTIARGFRPIPFGATPEEAARVGVRLVNPFAQDDERARRRGADVFAAACRSCHGEGGAGDGPVTRRGVPPPPSLLADKARQLSDGHIFHILTYGQANMAPVAAQVSREDRWRAVLHVRSLQQAPPPAPPAAVTQGATP